jgi:hypothetical protein
MNKLDNFVVTGSSKLELSIFFLGKASGSCRLILIFQRSAHSVPLFRTQDPVISTVWCCVV